MKPPPVVVTMPQTVSFSPIEDLTPPPTDEERAAWRALAERIAARMRAELEAACAQPWRRR